MVLFVRSHFPNPTIDMESWRLRVTGAVERTLELDLDEVRALPATTLAATAECAGNGRVYAFNGASASGLRTST